MFPWAGAARCLCWWQQTQTAVAWYSMTVKPPMDNNYCPDSSQQIPDGRTRTNALPESSKPYPPRSQSPKAEFVVDEGVVWVSTITMRRRTTATNGTTIDTTEMASSLLVITQQRWEVNAIRHSCWSNSGGNRSKPVSLTSIRLRWWTNGEVMPMSPMSPRVRIGATCSRCNIVSHRLPSHGAACMCRPGGMIGHWNHIHTYMYISYLRSHEKKHKDNTTSSFFVRRKDLVRRLVRRLVRGNCRCWLG